MRTEHKSRQKLLDTAMELIRGSSYGSISVDDICERAGVKKGSLYHFFKSKSDLTTAAMESHWDHQRVVMDAIFSPSVPPLQRLENYCQAVVEDQKRGYQAFGKVLGCPFCSLGK